MLHVRSRVDSENGAGFPVVYERNAEIGGVVVVVQDTQLLVHRLRDAMK